MVNMTSCLRMTLLLLLLPTVLATKQSSNTASDGKSEKDTDSKLKQALKDLSARDEKIRELEQTIQEVTSKLQATEKTLEGKVRHAKMLEKDAIELEEEKKELTRKVKNCDYDLENYQRQVQDTDATQSELVKEIAQMYGVYRDQEKRIGQCKKAKSSMEKEIEELKKAENCATEIREKEVEVIERLGGKINCEQEFDTQRSLLQKLKEVNSVLNSQIDSLTVGRESDKTDELSKCQSYGKEVRDAFEKCLDDWYVLLDKNKELEDAKPKVRGADVSDVPAEPQVGEQSDQWANCVRDLKLALEKGEVMEDKFTNCKATLDIVRGKLEKTTAKLEGVQETYDEIKDDCLTCDEELTNCEQARDLLDFEKRGIKMVMDMEEKKRKEAEAKVEEIQYEAHLALQSEAKYRHSFGISVFLLLVAATYIVYQIVVARVAAYSKTPRKATDSPKKKGGNKKKDN